MRTRKRLREAQERPKDIKKDHDDHWQGYVGGGAAQWIEDPCTGGSEGLEDMEDWRLRILHLQHLHPH